MSTRHSTKSSFFYNVKRDVVYRRLDFLGFPDYRVGTDGSVWSRKVERRRYEKGPWKRMRTVNLADGKGTIRKKQILSLVEEGKRKTYQVHRLVLLAFVGPCPDGMQCCHWDDHGDNNELSNLRWDYPEGNMRDKYRNGRIQKGESSPKSKLTNSEVRLIRRMIREKRHSLRKIGRIFGVNVMTIISVRSGRTWSHLD